MVPLDTVYLTIVVSYVGYFNIQDVYLIRIAKLSFEAFTSHLCNAEKKHVYERVNNILYLLPVFLPFHRTKFM